MDDLIEVLGKVADAAVVLLDALRWEELRSGTTYNGYENLQETLAALERVTDHV